MLRYQFSEEKKKQNDHMHKSLYVKCRCKDRIVIAQKISTPAAVTSSKQRTKLRPHVSLSQRSR